MTKPEVVVLGPRPEWYFERLEEDFAIHRIPNDDPAHLPHEVLGRVEVVTCVGAVGRRLIKAMPKLRLIANAGAGFEKIDLDAVRAHKIALTNTPDVTDGCVADLAFALLLAVTREVVRGDRFVRTGRWLDGEYPLVPRVFGRRLGILGLGRIGFAVARRGQGFDMPVFYHNRSVRDGVPYHYCATVSELARLSDYLVVACPGGQETHHLVNAEVLDSLGPQGIVVNISRGTIIDEQALVRALQEGRIRGAGLDVFEHEPHVPAELVDLDNVVLMPHRAGGTFETWQEACDLVRSNIWAHFEGRELPSPVAL